MKEKRTELHCYRVECVCPKCEVGTMEAGEFILTSSPPQYPSTCTSCGYEENLWVKYPAMRWETN